MKKRIILGVCGLVILIFLSSCDIMRFSEKECIDVFLQNAKFEKSDKMNIQLIGSQMVNTNDIRSWLDRRMVEDILFTFFFQFPGVEILQGEKEFNIDLSNFDFNPSDYQDKYFVITVGRELVEIRYKYPGPSRGSFEPKAFIVFAEEYNANILYLYATDQIPIFRSDLGGRFNSFYIMHGEERIFYGHDIFQVNTRLNTR